MYLVPAVDEGHVVCRCVPISLVGTCCDQGLEDGPPWQLSPPDELLGDQIHAGASIEEGVDLANVSDVAGNPLVLEQGQLRVSSPQVHRRRSSRFHSAPALGPTLTSVDDAVSRVTVADGRPMHQRIVMPAADDTSILNVTGLEKLALPFHLAIRSLVTLSPIKT